MASWQIALLSLHGVVIALVVWRHWVCHWTLKTTTHLIPDAPRHWERDDYWPKVSILVPAKDEADGIEACVQSLLKQDYPHFEVLVIDDRSNDDTAGIVERMARLDSRLRLIRIHELPAGWTGKTHALHVGQQQARGEWLLFVDADTRHHRSCVTTVVRDALQHKADMVSLLPALECRSFWESVIQPFAGTCLMIMYPLPKANDPNSLDGGFANGQFILVKRDVYDQIGQHEAVKDKFVEDIHLGRNTRKAGHRLRIVLGPDVSSVRMYPTLAAIVKGWGRIFYSAADCKPKMLYLMGLFIAIMSVVPYVAIAGSLVALALGNSSAFVTTALAMGVVHEALQLTLYARTYRTARVPLKWLAFRWLAVGLMFRILQRTIRTCRTHRIEWRGTKYGKEHHEAAAAREAVPALAPAAAESRRSA